jgi:hypothetical protein
MQEHEQLRAEADEDPESILGSNGRKGIALVQKVGFGAEMECTSCRMVLAAEK